MNGVFFFLFFLFHSLDLVFVEEMSRKGDLFVGLVGLCNEDICLLPWGDVMACLRPRLSNRHDVVLGNGLEGTPNTSRTLVFNFGRSWRAIAVVGFEVSLKRTCIGAPSSMILVTISLREFLAVCMW